MTPALFAERFAAAGYVRVERAFSPDDAGAMCEQLWSVFARRFGIERSDRSTWDRPFRKSVLYGVDSSLTFDELLTDRVIAVVDEILGPGTWELPKRGELLITFPNASSWTLPRDGWHQDWAFSRRCDPVSFFKAFAYLNEVSTGGGGTLVVEGSHRLAGRYGEGRVIGDRGVIKGSSRLYVECEWLRDLTSKGDDSARRQRFMDAATDVDGVPLRVVELSGKPGDLVIIHPWLIHAIAPNASDTPRFMRAPVFSSVPI